MRKIRRSNRKRKKKILVIATFALICCLTIGYAAFGTSLNLKAKGNVVILEDLYVASYGSDTTGNGTISRPFATIQKSYDRAGNNASIHLLDNITQKETINFDKNKDITLDSVYFISIFRFSQPIFFNFSNYFIIQRKNSTIYCYIVEFSFWINTILPLSG